MNDDPCTDPTCPDRFLDRPHFHSAPNRSSGTGGVWQRAVEMLASRQFARDASDYLDTWDKAAPDTRAAYLTEAEADLSLTWPLLRDALVVAVREAEQQGRRDLTDVVARWTPEEPR